MAFGGKKKKKPIKRGNGPRLTSGSSASKTGSTSKSSNKAPVKKNAGKKAPARKAPAKRRTNKKKTARVAWWKRRKFWSFIGTLGFTGIIMLLVAIIYFASDLPDISTLNTINKKPGITMKTKDGIILASYGDVYGDYVSYEELPPHLINAVLATEDRSFFNHVGIDIFGIARAMVVNFKAGRFVQGGSTITQQVAKNVFLTPERTLERKIQEMLLAFWLEGKFTKEEILAIYLNRVYLGAGTYGVDAASRRYFYKPATDLNLVESAIITGLLKAPSRYSPIANPERSKKRARQVLLNMVDAELLEQSQADAAIAEFKQPKLYRDDDPNGTRYFTDWVMDELPQYIGNVDEDLIIITTLDPTLQKEAEDSLQTILNEHGEEKKASQAALVSMTPDGAVKAMVGGKNYNESQYNRAVQAQRQAGSVFKLFVYLAALDAGMSPDTIIWDEPLEVPVGRRIWRPKNFDHKYRGEMTMAEALTQSINTVSVQLTMAVGVDRVVDMARRLGVKDVPHNPSIALGALETSLLDITGAYAHLANGGKGVLPYGIDTIYSQGGDAIYRRGGSGLWVVLRNSVVQQMNSMLMNVPRYGTGRRAAISHPMAGKTGTGTDYKDAWFVGLTGHLVTGVWVGNDNNSKMNRVTGGNLPAMIWKAYMTKALAGKPVKGLPSNATAVDDQPLPWESNNQTIDGIPMNQMQPHTLDQFIETLGLNDVDVTASDIERVPENEQPNKGGPELKESFWDKLMKRNNNQPAQREAEEAVEYDYPGSDKDRRRYGR